MSQYVPEQEYNEKDVILPLGGKRIKIQYLFILLIVAMFSGLSWAPPPERTELEKRDIAKKLAEEAAKKVAAGRAGGATGWATAFPDIDISKCDLKPSDQTKMKIKDKSGKEHFICSGPAVCGGKTVPVSCKVSEKELCPVAKKCVEFKSILIRTGMCKGTILFNLKKHPGTDFRKVYKRYDTNENCVLMREENIISAKGILKESETTEPKKPEENLHFKVEFNLDKSLRPDGSIGTFNVWMEPEEPGTQERPKEFANFIFKIMKSDDVRSSNDFLDLSVRFIGGNRLGKEIDLEILRNSFIGGDVIP